MKLWINNSWIPWQEIPTPSKGSFTEAVVNTAKLWRSSQSHLPFLTSGSTGPPKLINLSREAIQWVLEKSNDPLRWKEKQSQLMALHPSRIGGAMAIFRALEANQNVQIWEPGTLWSAHFFPPQLMSLVPYQLQKILQHDDGTWLQQCGVILLGGGPVHESLIQELQQFHLHVFHSYGMTETASMIALRQLSPELNASFRPLPQVTIRLGENGNLIVCGPQTENRDLNTHDLVEIDEKRDFKVLGRMDEVINSGGMKWTILDLETHIAPISNLFSSITGFFIWKEEDVTFGEIVVLGIECINSDSINHQLLMNFLDEKMPHKALPKKIKYFEKFIRMEGEKVNRKQNWDALEIKIWKK